MERLTAQEYRDLAQKSVESAQESFDRSDTDGFLSQHALQTMASRYWALADLAEKGWRVEWVTLFLNGKVASTHQGSGQYGIYWVLNDEVAEAYGKRFFSPSTAKNGTERDRAKGFTYGLVEVDTFIGRDHRWHPSYDDLEEGNYTIISTDGAYDHLQSVA